MPKSIAHFSPYRLIFASILIAIGIGTFLLSLSISQTEPIALLDVFFTATAATCVAGLSTVSLLKFSFIGHCIIMLLMQIGGLSLITLTLFLMSLFIKLGFRTQLMAGKLLELESWKDFKKILFFTIGLTFLIELIGTLLIYFSLDHTLATPNKLFLALFHAISCFTNSGLSIFPHGYEILTHNIPFLLISSSIMIAGGLGFITWLEIMQYLRRFTARKRFYFSLHSHIIFSMTAIIITAGTLIFWLLERTTTLQQFSTTTGWCNAFFMAVASRGTGLNTLAINDLQLATIIIIMIMAFIGAAPGSTGGGIKVTSIAIICAAVRTAVAGQSIVTMRGRTIAKDQILKAFAIFFLGIIWILGMTFCILLIEKQFSFIEILFEIVSAAASLGMSFGITPLLSAAGKSIIIVTMIIGRIGLFAFLLSLLKRHEPTEFTYPEERIML